MQHARDTFYVTLRDRLAAFNPARTIAVRGVSRPGVLVVENELTTDVVWPDAFVLHWSDLRVEGDGSLPLVTMECEIAYATDGTAGAGGMDRGQMLGAMDTELFQALTAEPTHVTKVDYNSTPAVAMGTDVFWGAPTYKAALRSGERVSRTATVEIRCYLEAGDL